MATGGTLAFGPVAFDHVPTDCAQIEAESYRHGRLPLSAARGRVDYDDMRERDSALAFVGVMDELSHYI